jgi:tetratricopeptide (TPR) repeat protein
LALNASSRAARFFAAASEFWPRDDPGWPLILLDYGKAMWLDDAGDEMLREAAEALLAAGDRAAAAEAYVRRAQLARRRGERDHADAQLERAAALASGLPPSRSTPFVLSSLCRFHMLAGEYEHAIRLGREALEVSKRLGLEENCAHALDNIGMARVAAGDHGGITDLEQAIEIAISVGSVEIVRANNNLGVAHLNLGDLRRARELLDEGIQAAQRFGFSKTWYSMRHLRSGLSWLEFTAGGWDDALRLADEFLAEFNGDSRHYLECEVRSWRGAIRLARSDLEGALADSKRGLEIAREAKNPPEVTYGLANCARVLLEGAGASEAASPARKALANVRTHPVAYGQGLPALAIVLTALGRGEELIGALQAAAPTPWVRAARCCANGDFGAAADIYADIGSLPDEADARLREAARLIEASQWTEAELQLERALAFYRSVEATRCVREAEALLANVA